MNGSSQNNQISQREQLELFLIHEARLLDERRFRDWMALFADDGIYWVPTQPGQISPRDHASLFYDDKELMNTRIERLEHPSIHLQTPASQTVHLVSNVTIATDHGDEAQAAGASLLVVHSNMVMVEYRLDRQRLFAARQRHVLLLRGDEIRIRQKRVDLVNCEAAFEAMAVPI